MIVEMRVGTTPEEIDGVVQKAKALAGIPAEVECPVITIRAPKAIGLPAVPAGLAQTLHSVQVLLSERALVLVPSELPFSW